MAGHPGRSMEEAFADLYSHHFKAVLGFSLRRTSAKEDAADAVAETFLIAWRRFGDVPAPELERAWLLGLARGTLANVHRGHRRRTRLTQAVAAATRLDDGVEPSHPDPSIGSAFRSLSTEDRELLQLAYWEDLQAREIATVVGCSANAARIRLHRARRRMRDALMTESRLVRGSVPITTTQEEAS